MHCTQKPYQTFIEVLNPGQEVEHPLIGRQWAVGQGSSWLIHNFNQTPAA
jgi:hypothetical protein